MKDSIRKQNTVRQGIISSSSFTLICTKAWINAKDKGCLSVQDTAIANAYVNKFIIPLNFEMPARAQKQTML